MCGLILHYKGSVRILILVLWEKIIVAVSAAAYLCATGTTQMSSMPFLPFDLRLQKEQKHTTDCKTKKRRFHCSWKFENPNCSLYEDGKF